METKVLPRLLAVSDSRSLTEPFESWLLCLREAAIPMVQIREKHLSDRALLDLLRKARQLLPPLCLVLVNERIDVALAAEADGVHLPSNGPPTAALRKRFGSRLILGRSTHHLEEVHRENREGADYVTFGPVFPTASKAPYGPPLGVEALAEASRGSIPVFALGGINPERLTTVAAAGAWGASGISMFQRKELPPLVSAAAVAFPDPTSTGSAS